MIPVSRASFQLLTKRPVMTATLVKKTKIRKGNMPPKGGAVERQKREAGEFVLRIVFEQVIRDLKARPCTLPAICTQPHT